MLTEILIIDDNPDIRKILNDLIIAAYNDCRDKLKKKTSEELLKATGGISLPFDFKLPF